MSFISKLTTLSAAGASSDSYWANILRNDDDRQSNLNWIAVGAAKEVYFGGYYHIGNGYNRADIMELDADGNYVRGIRNGDSSETQTASWGGCVGTSGYIVTGGYDLSSGYDPAYFIRNPTANSYSSRFEDSPGVTNSVCKALYTIGSNIYACVWRQIGSSDSEVAIVRGSGTTFSSRSRGFLNNTGDGLEIGESICDVTADSSGNMYIAAQSNYSGNARFYIGKMNSSFTNQWYFKYTYAFASTSHRLLVDSSGNIYLITTRGDSGTQGIHIIKFDSSGDIQFQKRAWAGGNDTASYVVSGAAIDSNDNIIVMTHSLNEPSSNQYIFNFDFVKFNSSGSVTDSCRWKGSSSARQPLYGEAKNMLALDANDNMYTGWAYRYAGQDGDPRRRFVAKFTFDTTGQNIGDFTLDQTHYYTSSSTSTYLNNSTKDNSPNVEVTTDSRSITNSSAAYTADSIVLNTNVTETVTALS